MLEKATDILKSVADGGTPLSEPMQGRINRLSKFVCLISPQLCRAYSYGSIGYGLIRRRR